MSTRHYVLSKHDLLFVHIPKTGGGSITSALNSQGGVDWKSTDHLTKYWRNRGILTIHHRNPYDLARQGIISDQYLTRSTIFSIVRDPVDRAISLWNHTVRSLTTKVRPFDQFWLKFPDLDEVREWNTIQSMRHGFELDFFAPQVTFLLQDDGTLDGINLFTFENFPRISNFLEGVLKTDVSIPHHSKSVSPKQISLRSDVRSRIHEIYESDYDFLRYSR